MSNAGADHMLITQTGAYNRGTDQSTHSHRLKGMTDADQPAHPPNQPKNYVGPTLLYYLARPPPHKNTITPLCSQHNNFFLCPVPCCLKRLNIRHKQMKHCHARLRQCLISYYFMARNKWLWAELVTGRNGFGSK